MIHQAMRFEKKKVLEKLRENREEHKKIFEESVEGYIQEAGEWLEKRFDEIRDGKTPNMQWLASPPESHEDAYNTIINMLEETVEDYIELNGDEFRSYMRDEWDWQARFLASNSVYSAAAATKNKRIR